MSLTGFMNPASWFLNWVYSSLGWDEYDNHEKAISSTRALSYAPIWYGVTKIAGHISQLPVNVFERKEIGGEKRREHPVAKLLRKPNEYQTHTVFFEEVAMHSLLEGNGRAGIVRQGSRIKELIPLDPTRTATAMIQGQKWHITRPHGDDRLRGYFENSQGNIEYNSTALIVIPDADVLHVPGLSMDGVSGLPLREVAKRNLNAAINQEKRIGKQMEQGFAGSLMLQAPAGMFRNQRDAEEFLDYFEQRHGSPDKAGKVGMLKDGMTANLIQSTNRDAEMTDNRKFARQDAALWLGLEQILGDDSSVSYNSLEQKNLAYLMNCLNRWLKRWEEELECKLLPSRQFERDSHYIRFATAALLKSDYKTSVEALGAAIASTIMSPNEAREKLDMLPYPGGDKFANPNTSTTADSTEDDSQDSTEDDISSEDSPAAIDARPAVRSRLESLIQTEANRVVDAARKAEMGGRNYIAWLDSFYANNWEPKLANWLEEMGLDRDAASLHCQASKDRLMEICDYATADNLSSSIAKAVTNWKYRAKDLMEVAVH